MKKSIVLLCAGLATFALSAFSYINWNNPDEIDLVYNVDSRFGTTITKEKLHQATSVVDIVPREAEWNKIAFLNMIVTIIEGDDEKRVLGDNEILNAEQTKLLQSIDYSTHFYLKGRGEKKGDGPDGLKDSEQEEFDFTYYLTVVPEKEAEYTAGTDALISYLRENSKSATAIIRKDKLQPGRVLFTVTKEGTIDRVSLDSSSGYPSVDEALIEIISSMTGKWTPATNAKGENVDQELVFFFGTQGC